MFSRIGDGWINPLSIKHGGTGADNEEQALRNLGGASSKELDIERQRINNFTKLPDGSTIGDAELKDIRVGADGTMYPNAGEAVRGQFSKLKNDFVNITKKMDVVEGDNKISELIDGYCDVDGNVVVSNNYKHTNLVSVNSGDVFRVYCVPISTGNFGIAEMRFVACYDSNRNIIPSAGSSSSVRAFTVPDGVKYVSASLNRDYQNNVCGTINKEINGFIPYIEPYYVATDEFLPTKLKNYKDYKVIYNNCVKVSKSNTLAEETVVVCENIDNRKNSIIECWCNIDSFTSIMVGHGTNLNYGNLILVNNDYISVHGGATNAQIEQIPHNLTISGFIHILIKQNSNAQAKVKVATASGTFETDNITWNGCDGKIFITTYSPASNVIVSATFLDLNKDVFIFGDSYTNMGSTTRYPYYLIADGYDNFLMSGFGGAKSDREILSFDELIKLATPKFAVWCLGMNDADTNSINTSWKDCVEHFISECNANGITPILSTIPNTPTINHVYKNEFVRSSGYRYIDFAKAVNAELSGASWYDGMLQSDNCHPTELGAKCLASRVIIDLPEIIG